MGASESSLEERHNNKDIRDYREYHLEEALICLDYAKAHSYNLSTTKKIETVIRKINKLLTSGKNP